MVGTKARSTLVAAETWQKDFIPYGTPCKEPCETGSARLEELAEELAAIKAELEAVRADREPVRASKRSGS